MEAGSSRERRAYKALTSAIFLVLYSHLDLEAETFGGTCCRREERFLRSIGTGGRVEGSIRRVFSWACRLLFVLYPTGERLISFWHISFRRFVLFSVVYDQANAWCITGSSPANRLSTLYCAPVFALVVCDTPL